MPGGGRVRFVSMAPMDVQASVVYLQCTICLRSYETHLCSFVCSHLDQSHRAKTRATHKGLNISVTPKLLARAPATTVQVARNRKLLQVVGANGSAKPHNDRSR